MESTLRRDEALGVDLRSVYDDLVRFETQLWDALDGELRAASTLSLAWFEVMQVIARVPGCRVVDVVEALSITVGGTSKLIDRIERAGLCQRAPNPNDGRSSIVTLTDEGVRVLDAARPMFDDGLQRLVAACLKPWELAMFGELLARLRLHTASVTVDVS
jgi:DNA-binding MarR family transcriptional regulator